MRFLKIVVSGLFSLTLLNLSGCAQSDNGIDTLAEKAARQQQDRYEIERTLVQYTTGLDTLDPDLYANAFTADAKFYRGNNKASVELIQEGRAGIRTIITDLIKSREQRAEAAARSEPEDGEGGDPQVGARMMHHVMTNAVIEFIDDNTAHHYSYWMTVVGSGRNFSVAGMGRYDDTLVKQEDGRWLISERNLMR